MDRRRYHSDAASEATAQEGELSRFATGDILTDEPLDHFTKSPSPDQFAASDETKWAYVHALEEKVMCLETQLALLRAQVKFLTQNGVLNTTAAAPVLMTDMDKNGRSARGPDGG